MHGACPLPCLALYSNHAESVEVGLSVQALHHSNEMDLYLRWKWRCDSLTSKTVAGTRFVVFAGVGALRCCARPTVSVVLIETVPCPTMLEPFSCDPL